MIYEQEVREVLGVRSNDKRSLVEVVEYDDHVAICINSISVTLTASAAHRLANRIHRVATRVEHRVTDA